MQPVQGSVHDEELTEEVFNLAVKVLRTTHDSLGRMDILYAPDRKHSADVANAVDAVIRAHTCINCATIRTFASFREMKHAKFMKMHPLHLKDFASEYHMMTAHIALSEKFYKEIYCEYCGNMRGHTTPKEEAEEFSKNYKKK